MKKQKNTTKIEKIEKIEVKKPKLTRGTKLRFSAYAWSKLLYMLDKGRTEIGGFGICETEDPLLITDFKLVKQECTPGTVELDTDDTQKFFESMDDLGLQPHQYSLHWIHTHPGNCPEPSTDDEKNFDTNFSHPHWSVFFIMAKNKSTYCRLRFNVGPGTEVLLENEVDYSASFRASNEEEWSKEYEEKVVEKQTQIIGFMNNDNRMSIDDNDILNVIGQRYEDNDIENHIWQDCGFVFYYDDDKDRIYKYDYINEIFYVSGEEVDTQIEYDEKKTWMNEVHQWCVENYDFCFDIEEEDEEDENDKESVCLKT